MQHFGHHCQRTHRARADTGYEHQLGEVLRQLRREVSASGKATPIAVVTAYGSADNAVVALKAGAFDYLSKPVALDQLIEKIELHRR